MRLRVVCGLEVTIAIFCPTRRFTSVDLPAFGRPTPATNPDRNSFFSCFSSLATSHSLCESLRPLRLCVRLFFLPALLILQSLPFCRHSLHLLANPHPQHFSLIRFQHLEPVAFEVSPVARRRHLAGNMTQQSRERRYRLVGFIAELHSEQFLHFADSHAAAHDQAAIGFAHHIRRRRLAVLAASFADDFLQQIFHGGDACHSSVFINDHCQRLAPVAHFAQQFRTHFRLRNKKYGFC